MFESNPCFEPGCQKPALSIFDSNGNPIEESKYCIDHIPNPEAAIEKIYTYIKTHDKIVGLNAAGITLTDIDISGKRFYGCNFQYCKMINIHSEGIRTRLCLFDFSTFSDCNLLKCNMQFSSFAGCTFSHILFTGSDMVSNNFCGIEAYQSSFDDSDLYNSRFIRAKLIDTSFRNCNVKKTIFNELEQQNVSFKMSNIREAEFDRAGSELFLKAGDIGDIG